MAIYSASVPIFQVANGTPAADFMAGQSNAPSFIELGANVGTAAATIFGIGRAAIAGVQVGGAALLPEDEAIGAMPCQTTVATQWSLAPKVPSIYLRRIQISGAAIGQGMILTFPRGLRLAENGSLVFWNLTATQAAGTVIYGVTDE